MKIVVCVPRWSDGGRRDEIWTFTRKWIEEYYPYPIFEGHHEGPGEARDAAAKAAGDWDIAIMHDADTLAHRDAIAAAIDNAVTTGCMTVAADGHMYMSKKSSDRLLAGDPQFLPRPYDVNRRSLATYAQPCSGIYAVSRALYDRIGGYPHAGIWGNEDQIWFELCRIFDGPVAWVPDEITTHLWHPPADRSSREVVNHPEYRRNRTLWKQLNRCRGPFAQARARELLNETLGHRIP